MDEWICGEVKRERDGWMDGWIVWRVDSGEAVQVAWRGDAAKETGERKESS
jgi:hypothetical protein